jgi:hypothetical protein
MPRNRLGKPDRPDPISVIVREFVTRNRIRCTAISEKSGVPIQTVRSWVYGRFQIKSWHLSMILGALGFTVNKGVTVASLYREYKRLGIKFQYRAGEAEHRFGRSVRIIKERAMKAAEESIQPPSESNDA